MSRYRRKTKDIKGSLPHSQHPSESHAPKPQHSHPNREEPGQQVHDEADLIQFRSDALNRFITNQEYMEKVASVAISCLKIVPPSIFPVPTPRPAESKTTDEQQASIVSGGFAPFHAPHSTLALELARSEQIYFGDLEWMKQESTRMLKELSQFQDSTDAVKFRNHDQYEYQREASERLYKLHQDLVTNKDNKSFAQLQQELDTVIREYHEKFASARVTESKGFKKYSVKVDDVVVTEAPANYNPRLVNTYINFYANPGDEGIGMPPGVGGPVGVGNRPHGQYYNINGGPMGRGQSPSLHGVGVGGGIGYGPGGGPNGGNVPYGNGGVFAGTPNAMESMQRAQMGGGNNIIRPQGMSMSSQNTPMGGSGVPLEGGVDSSLNADSAPGTNRMKPSEPSSISADLPGDVDDGTGAKHMDSPQEEISADYDNMIQEDLNNLFDDDDGLGLANDGINDLINFEDEDNGIMDDDAFDQDFLSQIDHGMK